MCQEDSLQHQLVQCYRSGCREGRRLRRPAQFWQTSTVALSHASARGTIHQQGLHLAVAAPSQLQAVLLQVAGHVLAREALHLHQLHADCCRRSGCCCAAHGETAGTKLDGKNSNDISPP